MRAFSSVSDCSESIVGTVRAGEERADPVEAHLVALPDGPVGEERRPQNPALRVVRHLVVFFLVSSTRLKILNG